MFLGHKRVFPAAEVLRALVKNARPVRLQDRASKGIQENSPVVKRRTIFLMPFGCAALPISSARERW